jgi:ATP-binding cassette subfamily G (WHITE) protein 2
MQIDRYICNSESTINFNLTNYILLSWNNLSIIYKKTNVKLINKLNGYIKSGFCAIMGQSGSGKTTFLSALAKRISLNQMKIEGNLYINNKEYTNNDLKKFSGYVMQDDILHSNLTVYETLSYASELKMTRNISKEDRIIKIENILNKLELNNCRNIIVGDSNQKGISGGEKKRLSIAIELLTDPKILFLDEPTSGLDSKISLLLIEKLKIIADEGCMIICTIHQPQNKIFDLFDNLILMKNGNIIYNGQASTAIENIIDSSILSILNFKNNINYGDILINQISNHNIKYNYENNYENNNNDINNSLILTNDISIFNKKDKQLWFKQFEILLRRNIKCYLRNYKLLLFNILSTIIVAFFVCFSVWNSIGINKKSVSLRQSALFFCVINQGIISSLQGTHSFPLERNIMLRERAGGSYHVSSYFLAKILSDTIFQIISPIIFTCIVYYNIGFQQNISKFFIFMGFMILTSIAATSISNMISCICISIELSTIILAAVYEISRLYGGWFISPKLLLSYSNWKFADALSYIKYAFIGVSLNENDNLLITCLPSELDKNGNCIIPPLNIGPYTGNAFNLYYGYDTYTIEYCTSILIVYIVLSRLFGYIALKYIKY